MSSPPPRLSPAIERHYRDAFGKEQTADPDIVRIVADKLGIAEPDGLLRSGAAPSRAYCGDFDHGWILAVQLYALRSPSSAGIGDFSDLAALLRVAAKAGADGVGLNPLHALLHSDGDDRSPYWPSSRLFLDPQYISLRDVSDLPEDDVAVDAFARLNQLPRIDYAGVAAAKESALRSAFTASKSAGRGLSQRFRDFCSERGALLQRYAVFEELRRRHDGPWWTWPDEWHRPSDEAVASFYRATEDCAFFAYQQWLAHEQLMGCNTLASSLGMRVGLYLDVAVGVRPDGFDAWNAQDEIFRGLSVGAPPDLLNADGQNWGLSGFNPAALASSNCAAFRAMLQASMRYAGALRIDHVLGLKRLFVIPEHMSAKDGVYLNMPLASLLSVLAEESRAHSCIVIGEALGTVPEGFRELLLEWGVWSYRVMMFERDWDRGEFLPASSYPADALVTFSTHDLPPFSAWIARADLELRSSLDLASGETDVQRTRAIHALAKLTDARGEVAFKDVAAWLSHTPSRLLAIAIEDVLGIEIQINLPGTQSEYPNWQQRLPVDVSSEALERALSNIAAVLVRC